MSLDPRHFIAGALIRRSLFFIVLIILTLGNLFTLFRGLNSPQAMDQAQIAREIARGNGFATKMIRPVAYYQAEKTARRTVPLQGFQDTYHSPLNPLLNAAVLKLIGADKTNSWQMSDNEMVYPLDRVIATVCTLFFLIAIGVNYLLISRIFDTKIAGVCAILMLFCEVFWNYSLSGLPQMLMLLLFSSGLYFAYRATEASTEGRIAMTPAIIAGIFFTLLALAHWMTVWISLGYIIYAAIAFRPRGIVGISILGLLLVAGIGPMVRNIDITGSPFGTAFLTLYNGLGNGTETTVMRNSDLEAEPLVLDGLIAKVLRTTLTQATDIVPLLAGIIVAPLFFLALLHPFKRKSIANFRWAILLMWVSTAFGLAFFGMPGLHLDPLDAPRFCRLDAHAAKCPPLHHHRHLCPAARACTAIKSAHRHAPQQPRRRAPLAALLRTRAQQRKRRERLHDPKASGVLGPTLGRRMVRGSHQHLAATQPRRIPKTRDRRKRPPDAGGRNSHFALIARLGPGFRSGKPLQGLHLAGA
ncbi:MAG: hypothetical protein NTU84_07025 [Verrucomicrobia bacterium]|nr:hypothetical protein [Verrucomicrobiota bacterium]